MSIPSSPPWWLWVYVFIAFSAFFSTYEALGAQSALRTARETRVAQFLRFWFAFGCGALWPLYFTHILVMRIIMLQWYRVG